MDWCQLGGWPLQKWTNVRECQGIEMLTPPKMMLLRLQSPHTSNSSAPAQIWSQLRLQSPAGLVDGTCWFSYFFYPLAIGLRNAQQGLLNRPLQHPFEKRLQNGSAYSFTHRFIHSFIEQLTLFWLLTPQHRQVGLLRLNKASCAYTACRCLMQPWLAFGLKKNGSNIWLLELRVFGKIKHIWHN